jgi:hypothetical protein
MLSGQVQSRFKDEKALEPSAIEDLQKLLDETAPGNKVRNHRKISGLTVFEMEHMKWDKLVLVPEIWCFLVVGEDPNNAAGCIAAMRLATRYGVRNGKAITTHGRRLNDTRGGIPIVAWCDAFQFKRTYTRGGRITSSYTALQKVRVRYCRRLLERFAAQDSFRNQDWQAIQASLDAYLSDFLPTSSRILWTNTKIYCISMVSHADLMMVIAQGMPLGLRRTTATMPKTRILDQPMTMIATTVMMKMIFTIIITVLQFLAPPDLALDVPDLITKITISIKASMPLTTTVESPPTMTMAVSQVPFLNPDQLAIPPSLPLRPTLNLSTTMKRAI